jgi:hypothetical protein
MLIYKIYSVWLYQNQLQHEWIFFYNRKRYLTGGISWDPPYYMFGSSDLSASTKIHDLDKSDPNFISKSIDIVKLAALSERIELISAKDIISLVPCGESQISYSGCFSPGDVLETEGRYKGLKKNIYTPYDIMFNETKAGFNPHEYEVMGVWNSGDSSCSTYRIWEEVSERDWVIRDKLLDSILK